jgi:hypothetical protein
MESLKLELSDSDLEDEEGESEQKEISDEEGFS